MYGMCMFKCLSIYYGVYRSICLNPCFGYEVNSGHPKWDSAGYPKWVSQILQGLPDAHGIGTKARF